MREISFFLEGMMCEGCENRVKNALSAINGVKEVEADFKTGQVRVKAQENVALDMLEEKIDDIGFEVVKE